MANPHSEEERCDCGKLLFKKSKRGFEFKCSRCKRVHLIPFDRIYSDDEFHPLCPVVDPRIDESSKQSSGKLSQKRKD